MRQLGWLGKAGPFRKMLDQYLHDEMAGANREEIWDFLGAMARAGHWAIFQVVEERSLLSDPETVDEVLFSRLGLAFR